MTTAQEKIKAVLRAGISQERLAKLLGVSQGMVSSWVSGSVPSVATQTRINGILGIKNDWIRGEK